MFAKSSDDQWGVLQPVEFAVNCNAHLAVRDRPPPTSDNYPSLDPRLVSSDPSAVVDPLVGQYCQASRSANTRRAYASDLTIFQTWGGHFPSTPDEIARYLAYMAGSLRPATLRRRLAALASAHQDADLPDPTKSRLVQQVMQGVARSHGNHPAQVAPLLLDDISRILAVMGDTPTDVRDRSLLLMGFFGALRRSEIVALNFEDVCFRKEGLNLTIRKSKTDQLQVGRTVHLRRVRIGPDPGEALRDWLAMANIREGAVFRGQGGSARLSSRTVARIVKKWASAAGLPASDYSGHSLRAGFATSAALAGLDATLIARQTGHKSQQTVAAYVRAAGTILDVR